MSRLVNQILDISNNVILENYCEILNSCITSYQEYFVIFRGPCTCMSEGHTIIKATIYKYYVPCLVNPVPPVVALEYFTVANAKVIYSG